MIDQCGYFDFGICRYYVTISVIVTEEMKEWCRNNYKINTFAYGIYNLYFKNEADRNWFVLRWS